MGRKCWICEISASPFLLENTLGPFPPEELCPSKFTARKTLPSGLQGADFFLPFSSQLKCHFLRGSLDLYVWSHHWSSQAVFFFFFPSSHLSLSAMIWFLYLFSCQPSPLSCKLQGTSSGLPLPRAMSGTKQASNKFFFSKRKKISAF